MLSATVRDLLVIGSMPPLELISDVWASPGQRIELSGNPAKQVERLAKFYAGRCCAT
jgi:hypothetical protein